VGRRFPRLLVGQVIKGGSGGRSPSSYDRFERNSTALTGPRWGSLEGERRSLPLFKKEDVAGLVADAVDAYADGARRQQWLGAVGPFQQRDAVAAHEIEQAEIHQLGEAAGAIGVDVMDR